MHLAPATGIPTVQSHEQNNSVKASSLAARTNTLAWAGMIIARPRSSWHRPKETTVSSRDRMASTRSGGVRSSLSAAGTDERAVMKRRGCSTIVNPSVSPAGTGHNYSRSSTSAEGTAGNGAPRWTVLGQALGSQVRSPRFSPYPAPCRWRAGRIVRALGPGSSSRTVRAPRLPEGVGSNGVRAV